MKKTLLSVAFSTLLSASAYAAPIYFDVGFDGGTPDGNSVTEAITQLGFTGTLATSFYYGDPTAAGVKVVDTNIVSVMNANGFTAGPQTSLASTPIDRGPALTPGESSYPAAPGQVNIDSLNSSGSPTDLEGFVSGVGFPGYISGLTWGLTYEYEILGETTGTGVNYNDGYFNIFYENGVSREQVLRINITDSALTVANLNLFGFVSFDFDGNGTDDAAGNPFIQGLFNDATTGMSFYDLWLVDPNANRISFVLDTNVDPPVPTPQQLWASTGINGETVYIRQTTLDGSASFNVPEPFSLALVGAGLLGLGLTRRSKKYA